MILKTEKFSLAKPLLSFTLAFTTNPDAITKIQVHVEKFPRKSDSFFRLCATLAQQAIIAACTLKLCFFLITEGRQLLGKGAAFLCHCSNRSILLRHPS